MSIELAPGDVDALIGDGWRPQVVKLRPQLAEPVVTTEAIFDAFLRAAENEGEGRIFFNHELDGGIFNRQGGKPTPREVVPRADDGGFAGYEERMTRQLGGRRFCLRLVDAQVYGHTIFDRVGAFTRLLREKVERVDPVPRGMQSNVFVGNYDFSPFGAHADGVPQMQYLVAGRRRAHFWVDPAYWRGRSHDEALRPWEHLDHAQAVDLEPGDVVYWPMTAEHVFTCKSLAVAITVTFLPRPAATTEIERRARRSAHGFNLFPPARPADALRLDTRLRGKGTLVEVARGAARSDWVANGFIVSVEGAASTDGLLARLRSGATFAVADAMADLRVRSPDMDPDAALDLVRALFSARAVDEA